MKLGATRLTLVFEEPHLYIVSETYTQAIRRHELHTIIFYISDLEIGTNEIHILKINDNAQFMKYGIVADT